MRCAHRSAFPQHAGLVANALQVALELHQVVGVGPDQLLDLRHKMAVGRRLCGLAVAESHAQGGALLAKELGKLSVGELDAIQLAARLQRLVLHARRFGACIGDEAVAELHAQPQHGQLLVRLRLVLLDLDGVVKRARLHGREHRRGGDVRRRVRQVERHTEACERR